MKNLSFCIPNCVPDLGGAASMLMELGGMVILHDAAGCCETYTVFDEPRWFGSDSMVYSSSLQQLDAVLGNDEPLISSAVESAKKLDPSFIAIIGSPIPAAIGMDLDGIAMEIEYRCNIPSFAVHSNGFNTYEKGAGEALERVIRRFADEGGKGRRDSLNLLGATPLDFSNGIIDRVGSNLAHAGYTVNGVFCMGASIADIKNIFDAEKNLVISSAGLPAARYLKERFGMKYSQAIPFTHRQAETLSLLREKKSGKRCLVIGEKLTAEFLADAIAEKRGWDAKALQVGIPEQDTAETIASGYDVVVGDPLYKALLPAGTKFFGLPHKALSSNLFQSLCPTRILETLLDYPGEV